MSYFFEGDHNMARKAKKRVHKMPPLSFLDKLIYWTAFLLICAVLIFLVVITFTWRNQIAYADNAVIAKTDSISVLWALIPLLTFMLMAFILWYMPYEARRPIFGRKNFKYGPPAWPKIYPLFMKNKPYVYESERKKKDRKVIAVILLAVLLISFIPFPWSLYGRSCLKYDGSIVQYNMFNSQTQMFLSGQVEKVEVETYRYSTGKYAARKHWGVQMRFTTDSGKKYTFEFSDFHSDTDTRHAYWLTAMLNVKKRYDPSIVRFNGKEDLNAVVQDKKLTDEETKLLYQLFQP